MTIVAIGITAIGIVLAIALAVKYSLDATALVILALLLATGALVVAIVKKTRAGATGPAICDDCGGLNSPHATRCVHCGEALTG